MTCVPTTIKMDTVNNLSNILEKFCQSVRKPESYLSLQDARSEEIKSLTKSLYDITKALETTKKFSEALPELVVQDFDEEQIWQEIELQNNCICDSVVSDVAHLLAKKTKIYFPSNKDDESENEEVENEKEVMEEEEEEEDDDEDDDEEEDIDTYESEKKVQKQSKKSEKTIVDDQFFKLRDMEKFLEKMERSKVESDGEDDEDVEDEDDINYFVDDSSESEEQNEDDTLRYRYSDFFDAPEAKKVKKEKKGFELDVRKRKVVSDDVPTDSKKKKKRKVMDVESNNTEVGLKKKKVSFAIDEESSDEELQVPVKNEVKKPKSSFEMRQERLKHRIADLEEEALASKTWQMQGEVGGVTRPQNSLLEEVVEFDLAARPAPVATEQSTLRLEEVILQRVRDKAWDDVERKIKPVEDIRDYKKTLVLNQEKSKLSLAEIYEQEYMKQRDAKGTGSEEVSLTRAEVQEEPPEHVEIKKLMKGLMLKLEALSNFHYTPKQVAPEVKIISNLPAIVMEEVAPVSTSDAMLLAPEEVKKKEKGEVLGRGERTKTDKLRERRQKKQQQRLRQNEKEKRSKLIEKLNPGLGNKYSKERANQELEKAAREGKVGKLEGGEGKKIKSSTAFFSRLQDEVKCHIKSKSSSGKEKKQQRKFSAKKLKL